MVPEDAPTSPHRFFAGTHTVPLFEGRSSRRHQHAPLWKLLASARLNRVLRGRRLRGVDTFVQFAGFPRSGHSLIGSILDAHPQALVSHELDAMGLLKKGFSQASIFALIDKNSTEFTRHGRYWNGLSYLVPGGHHADPTDLRVIGDKKGDWAVRWIAQDPHLLHKLRDECRVAKKWILVLRNPFDNIATMSLRQGRGYDKLRISSRDDEGFRRELKKRQGESIADEALNSMIDDYAALCETVEKMKRMTPADDWCEVCYEDLAANPQMGIDAMLTFLALPADDDYVKNCAGLVNKKMTQSRRLVRWSNAKRERVQSLIRDFSFLNRYESDNDL